MIQLAAAIVIAGAAFIVDGDTIRVDGQTVRLWGIDAPEVDTDRGRRARQWLQDWIAGEHVECRVRGADHYGRMVALCRWGEVDVAELLVDNGHAVDWPRYSGGHYGGLLR